ncbi:MAG: hypothetical protein QM820_51635 [Minicystis sp.]
MSNSIRILVGLSLAAASTGCHAFDREYLDPKVASHVVVTKAEPPASCELVGFIKGSTSFGDLGDAHGEVLRSAVLRGGNYVSIDLVERPLIAGVGGYTVRGRLFNCPAPGRAPVAATPVAPAIATPAAPVSDATTVKACEPDCATGFTCQLGVCVSALPAQAGR